MYSQLLENSKEANYETNTFLECWTTYIFRVRRNCHEGKGIPSGLIRYPGGKTKLLRVINSRLQRMFSEVGMTAEFREPFLGGGAVGLSLLAENQAIRRAWLNDRDPAMAALWDAVIQIPTSLRVFVEDSPRSHEALPSERLLPRRHGSASIDLGAVRFATGIFTLPEAIALARPCESELLVGHGVGPDIAGRSR